MDNRTKRLETESIGRLLTIFSVPAIIGMVVNALYSVIDRIFVGQGVGPLAITAVTISTPLMIVGMAFGMLVGIGATALISLKLGEKRHEEAELIFGNAIVLAIIISVTLAVAGFVFLDPLLKALGAVGEVYKLSKQFMIFVLIGVLPQTFSMALNSIIRGEGNPQMAMKTMLIGALLNVILNPLFIFVFKMGIAGSSLATAISMTVSSVWVLIYFLGSKSHLKIRKENLKLKRDIVLKIFSIGSSPFAVQMGASLVFIVFNSQLLKYGNNIDIAVIGIIMSINMVIIMPVLGISQGVQPIVGYNYGAGNYLRVRKALKLAIVSSTVICTVGFFFLAIFSNQIMSLFSKDEMLVATGEHAIRIVLLFLPIIGFQVISANYFQSVGKPKHAIFLSASRQILFLIPLLFILPLFWGIDGIWRAGPISDFLSSLLTGVFILKEIKHLAVK